MRIQLRLFFYSRQIGLLFFISLGSIFANLQASDKLGERLDYTDQTPVLTEIKAGYFYPTHKLFREIYSGAGIYGIEISCRAWKGLYPWVSASYFSQSGYSIGGHNRTFINFIPLGFGLKYIHSCHRYLDVYIGLGGTATYLHMKDHSPYVIPSTSKWGSGGILKLGFLINMTNRLFLDVFSDYSFIKIDFQDTHKRVLKRNPVSLSGFSCGGSIGIRF